MWTISHQSHGQMALPPTLAVSCWNPVCHMATDTAKVSFNGYGCNWVCPSIQQKLCCVSKKKLTKVSKCSLQQLNCKVKIGLIVSIGLAERMG